MVYELISHLVYIYIFCSTHKQAHSAVAKHWKFELIISIEINKDKIINYRDNARERFHK